MLLARCLFLSIYCGELGLALLLSASPTSAAAELKTWRHAIIEPKGDAGFSMMVGRRGFGERQGLKIDIVVLKNGALAHKALLAGELDSIESSPGAAIMAASRGGDLKIIGCSWRGVPQGLLAGPRVSAIGDLKGKTLATAAPGSMPDLLARALLAKHAIPAADVKFANLGGDQDRYKAVLAGVTDAGIVAAEFLSIAPPQIRQLVAGRDVLPQYVRLCITVAGGSVTKRGAETARFLAAAVDALRHAVSHREETIGLTREVIQAKADDPRPAFAFDDAVSHRDVDPDVTIPLANLEWMQGELVKTGNLRQPGDLTKLVAPEIRERAFELLGK